MDKKVFRLDFRAALLLAPIAYAIHHAEENLVYDFRAWRLTYFADNNPLSTEAVFVILTGITVLGIFLHAVFQNKATAYAILLHLMGSQVVNAFFHTGATLYFDDFSPGMITGLLIYLPVNAVIGYKAIQEGWATPKSLVLLFVLGALIFGAFEAVGPLPMLSVLIATYIWIGYEVHKTRAVSSPNAS